MELFEKEEKHKTAILDTLDKSIQIIPVILVFIVAISFILYFSMRHSAKNEPAVQTENETAKAFASSFSVVVKDAGYLKRNVDSRDIFIPALHVQVANVRSKPQDRLLLIATFAKERRSICSGTTSLFNLSPGDSRDVELKCIESTGFGAIGTGMSLLDASESLAYELWLKSDGLMAKVAADNITFKILSSLYHP